MLRAKLFLLICAAGISPAAESLAARWEGLVRIPGRPVRLVLDLAQDSAGKWIGSVILPDRGIKGATLFDLTVRDANVTGTIKGLMGDPQIAAHVNGAGTMAGEFRQGGNTAPVELKRTGPAQVDPPRRSTTVPKELEGDWEGQMTVMGNPVKVKLSLANHAGDGATAKIVITGRRVTTLDVDLVTEQSGLLTLEVLAAQMTIEGRFRSQAGEIAGTYQQGPIEAAVVFRRAAQ